MYWKIKALNNVHSLIVLFIEITGAWPRPPAQKAVVMETARDANLTTTDIQTRRDTSSPASPHQNSTFQQGPNLLYSFLARAGMHSAVRRRYGWLQPHMPHTAPQENSIQHYSLINWPKSILCFQCLLKHGRGKGEHLSQWLEYRISYQIAHSATKAFIFFPEYQWIIAFLKENLFTTPYFSFLPVELG